jgi:hypothetical protein
MSDQNAVLVVQQKIQEESKRLMAVNKELSSIMAELQKISPLMSATTPFQDLQKLELKLRAVIPKVAKLKVM